MSVKTLIYIENCPPDTLGELMPDPYTFPVVTVLLTWISKLPSPELCTRFPDWEERQRRCQTGGSLFPEKGKEGILDESLRFSASPGLVLDPFACAQSLQLCLTVCDPMACSPPLSMGFFRQEYWWGLLCSSPGDCPNPGIKLVSPALAGRFVTTEPPGKPLDPSTGLHFNSSNTCCIPGTAGMGWGGRLGQTGGFRSAGTGHKWFCLWASQHHTRDCLIEPDSV